MDGELKKSPEAVSAAPEIKETREAEAPREVQPVRVEAAPAEPAAPPPAPVAVAPAVPPVPTDPSLAVVERVLEDGLRETFFSMSKPSRDKFRALGEDVARRLCELKGQGKVRPNVIHRLIDRWLTLIPHLNAFWLFQAGKIKTDRVIKEMDDVS